MGKIVLLDDLTINQIAAGEVIERPASVVKELVENSIDAGAKNITIDIKNGGISYIRITDNGSGILPDDMEIAFERHATSKIRSADDLDEVKSMGFRGEALASIAAIAKVDLVSKAIGQDNGYEVVMEGGDIKEKHEAGCAQGTSITITELFYNTPVRYKFLKKDFTETGYIEEIIQRIALANPNVSIKLVDTGKTTIQTTGSGKIEDAIYAIFGKEIVENILPVDYMYEDLHITGVIGKPIISRSNRSNQLFYVNHRFIKDKTLTSAAEQGFKGLVTIGKHGFLILNLDMDPKKVDVNVHPTKLEVRFQEDSKVFKAVYHAIKETLLKCDLVSEPDKDYSSMTPNDMLKDIRNNSLTNKARVEAWGLGKASINSKLEEKAENYSTESTIIPDIKPEFNEFKDTISKLDDATRRSFINEIANAKTTEEIIKGVNNFANLNKGENNATNSSIINEAISSENLSKSNESATDVDNKLSVNADESNEDMNSKNVTEKLEDQNENSSDLSIGTENSDLVLEAKTSENANEILEAKTSENSNAIIENEISENPDATIESKSLENSNETENKPIEDKAIENEAEVITEATIINNNDTVAEENKIPETEESFEEMYRKLFGRDIEDAKKEYAKKIDDANKENPIKPINNNEISMFENKDIEKTPPYNFVGIAFKTYIILTMQDELYILDQHAAHERIMYEKVKENYYSTDDKDSQLMLLPDIIALSNKEMGIFRDNKDLFNKAGFIVDEFGENTVKLSGVPEFCLDFNTKEIFLETLDEIDTVARTAKQELENKFLATVACKAAVKAHMALTKEEVDSLMQQLLKLPNPFSCPHGRPTVIKMSKNDIEKKFSRR